MADLINQTPKSSSLPQIRRSANYKPNIWEYNLVQSLTTYCIIEDEIYAGRKKNLVDQVMLHLLVITDKKMVVPILPQALAQLEMIDDLERLGLGDLFEKEIKIMLDQFYACNNTEKVDDISDLHCVALCFRLFRKHGYMVSQDMFKRFMNQQGNFITDHCNDIKGLLSLFEASSISLKGEHILDAAKVFSNKCLNEYYYKGAAEGASNNNNNKRMLMTQIEHALELPRHLRMLRLEARWYIDEYAKKECVNHVLLELAKLEFNMVQSIHQQELKQISKWWRDLKLLEQLDFTRDRVVECFLGSVGLTFEPQFGNCRKGITKVGSLITTIDDVYDIYGTLDELELFTSIVERWDINEVAQLPSYMQICFLALHNTIDEFAYDTFKENGFDILSYLKRSWIDLCKAFLVEARWYHNRYVPTFEEYMNNGWISCGGPTILLHAYIFSKNENTSVNALNFFESKPNLIRWPSIVLRLTDDLETSSAEIKRGDVPKSIQCYMHHNGVSEEVAREYIKHLLDDTWKKMNKELYAVDSNIFVQSYGNIGLNLGRMSQCMFRNGDGYGIPDGHTKDQIVSLLVEPILLIQY